METTKQEYQEWLKTLKKGDIVALRYGRFSIKYRISEIKNITPKGKIRLIHDTLLDENGFYLDSNMCGKHEIFPITDTKYIEYVERENLLNKINKINFQQLSNEDFKKIIEVLGL